MMYVLCLLKREVLGRIYMMVKYKPVVKGLERTYLDQSLIVEVRK